MAVGVSAPTLQEQDLGRRIEIGSGGMAKVYAVPDFFLPETPGRKYVYKKFRAKIRPVPLYGMASLVRLYNDLAVEQREHFDRAFNWPVRAVVDGGDGAAGLILPLLPDGYFVDLHLSSGRRKRKPAEGQFLFAERGYCARVGVPFPDEQQRRALCRSLAYAFGLLDRADVVYGDLSSRNFLFRLTPRPSVLLVDCDAVRPHGGAAAVGLQPHSPDWEPPEALLARQRRDSTGFSIQNKETDRYKLGLAILRILTPGDGCSVNVDPSPARSVLPPNLYDFLRRSLGDAPKDRPTARQWYQELTR